MQKILSWLLLLSVCLTACHKGNNPSPNNNNTPKVTGIKGVVTPASLAGSFNIYIANTGSHLLVQTLKTDANGNFSITNLPPGAYTVSFDNITGYSRPGETLVTIVDGQVSDMNVFTYISFVGTGSITGKVSPAAGALTPLRAVNTINGQTYPGTVNADGVFNITGLPAGPYTITLYPAINYAPANTKTFTASANATLAAGQTLDIGTLQFYAYSDPACPFYMAYTLDGKQLLRERGAAAASYTSPNFDVHTYDWGSIARNDSGETTPIDGLYILLDDVTGPGTYVCKGTKTSTIRLLGGNGSNPGFIAPSVNPNNIAKWSTIGAGGQATVTITSIDPVARTLAGTFTATLVPEGGGATGTRTITNGVFANYMY